MKFACWLHRENDSVEHIRLSKQIMKGTNQFPTSHSRKNSLIIFCEKYNQSDTVKDALLKSWGDFIKLPYATVTPTFNSKKIILQQRERASY
jgi:hypothetical protein